MKRAISFYLRAVAGVERIGFWALPLAARFVFLAVLAPYFWASAATKFESFPLILSAGAYGQIFPHAFDAVFFDATALALPYKIVAFFGTWAEIILPLAIIIGLFTRGAAAGMIGFILVQSVTDVWGHGIDAGTIGAWFDRESGALIMDQRALWIVLLLIFVLRGAGAVSLDHLIKKRRSSSDDVNRVWADAT